MEKKVVAILRSFLCIILLLCSWASVNCQTCSVLSYNDTQCIPVEEAINASIVTPACHDALTPFDSVYVFLDGHSCINIVTEQLHDALISSAVSPMCVQVLTSYFCNYIYPGCNPNATVNQPFGICEENCLEYVLGMLCTTEFNSLRNLGMTTGMFRFPLQCENTLQFVVDSGLNVSNSDEESCKDISDLITITPPPPPSPNPMPPDSSTDVTNAIILPSAISASLLLAIVLSLLFILYIRRKKAKQRPLLESSVEQRSSSNYYHGDNHQYDEVPLFQLTHGDALFESPRIQSALVPFENLRMEEEIGQGAFGCVYKGLYSLKQEDGQEKDIEVAVKTIRNSTVSYVELKGFIEESTIMCDFNHPHVLGLVGICMDENNSPYLILPYMDNGDLKHFLKLKRDSATNLTDSKYPEPLNENLLMKICSEVASGMAYLALQKLVHRDLAARNCMVDKNLQVRVADFGLTRDIYETDYYRQHHRTMIPVKWMAPESLTDRISNEKTDVWSYGVTCWEVFSLGRTPYPTISNADMLEYLESGNRLRKPRLCPEALFELMRSCWEERPEQRPTFAEIASSIVVHRADTPSDLIDGAEDEDEMFTNLDFNVREFMNDSESLVTSILNLIASHNQTEPKEQATTPTSCSSPMGDYTDMRPLSRPLARNGSLLTGSDHYDQAPRLTKPGSDCEGAGPTSHDCNFTRSQSARYNSSVHVRDTSSCSDYYPMFAAEPATVNIK